MTTDLATRAQRIAQQANSRVASTYIARDRFYPDAKAIVHGD